MAKIVETEIFDSSIFTGGLEGMFYLIEGFPMLQEYPVCVNCFWNLL
jgi:hypothetical protein